MSVSIWVSRASKSDDGVVLCYLPPVCCHCGVEDNLLDDFSEYVEEIREELGVVRPICHGCRHAGKDAKTWGQKVFKKRKT